MGLTEPFKKAVVIAVILGFLCSFCFVVAPVASAQTINVPDNYPTIAEAIKKANAGDTVFVKTGTYEEHELIVDKQLSLIGENARNTIIDNVDGSSDRHNYGSGTGIRIQANNVQISGFTIQESPKKPYTTFTAISGETSDTTIDGNILNAVLPQFFTSGMGAGGIFLSGDRNKILNNNAESAGINVHNSDFTVIAHNTVAGIYVDRKQSGNTTISFNTVGQGGITVAFGDFDTVVGNTVTSPNGISIKQASNTIVAKNVVTNPEADQASRSGLSAGGSSTVCENTVTGFSLLVGGGYNKVYSNTVTDGYLNLYSSYGSLVFGNSVSKGALYMEIGYSNIIFSNQFSDSPEYGAVIGKFQSEIQYRQDGAAADNNTFFLNNFIHNNVQVKSTQVSGYRQYGSNYFDNGSMGNYWSDYAGKDANGDGIGDTPYVIDSSRQDNFPLTAPFDISRAAEIEAALYSVSSSNQSSTTPNVTVPSQESNNSLQSGVDWLQIGFLIVLTVIAAALVAIAVLLYQRNKSASLRIKK